MRLLLTGLLSLVFIAAFAQRVQTIVPRGPVVAGTAFQVQYVVTEPAQVQELTPPAFEGFRVVSGPNKYGGNATVDGQVQPILNIAFTLVPNEAGTQKIEGLKLSLRNGNEITAPASTVLVSPPPRASFNALSNTTDLSRPAPATPEEREQMVRENLFIRVYVDRRTCYVGEPVLATFRLYSSLQSSSELERAPALYGFSVVDVLDINQAHQAVETIRGQVFNTYTLRKVQLYPGQSGKLLIDEMIVQNEIELPDSGGVHLLKRALKTEPVTINVLPLPEPQPADYGAAVGRFTIDARFERPNMAANEQNRLLLTLKGRGNFIQLSPPQIAWPKGIDVFEPSITDSLRYDSAWATGTRSYRYAFAPSDTGWVQLPPLVFVYFDPADRAYHRDSTLPLKLYVGKAKLADPGNTASQNQRSTTWISLAALLLSGVAIWRVWKGKKKKPASPPVTVAPPYDALAELQALGIDTRAGTEACTRIRQILQKAARELPLSQEQLQEIRSILDECQMFAFTQAGTGGKVAELRQRAITVLQMPAK